MGEGEVKELASLSRGQQHSGAPVGVDKVCEGSIETQAGLQWYF